MVNLSEEEIINAINSFINAIEIYGIIDYKCIPNLYEPVIGLLDLYNKEKEKNKKYQGIEKGTTIIYKSKAKYVREDKISRYYIDKNIIREKIRELEQELEEERENGVDFTFIHEHEIDINGIIEVLHELLEED